MTALNSNIIYNNTDPSASDTQASGVGPSTAVSVMIQTSAGSNVATASPTTGFSVGDLMFIDDSSFTGRRFNTIAAITSGSITFDENWDDDSFGSSAWVGGIRQGSDFATDPIITDAPDNSVIEIQYTGSDYNLSAAFQPQLGSVEGGPVSFIGTGSDLPRIVGPTSNSSTARLLEGCYAFKNLKFVQNKQSGSGVSLMSPFQNNVRLFFDNCSFLNQQPQAGGYLFSDGRNATHEGLFFNCTFDGNNKMVGGYRRNGGTGSFACHAMINCHFRNINGIAIELGDSRSCVVRDNVITNSIDGIVMNSDSTHQNTLDSNIFYNISNNGVTFNNDNNLIGSIIESNVFCTIGGDAIHAASDYSAIQKLAKMSHNAFHSVTGSTHHNLTAGSQDITLTGDPFEDAAGGLFNINDTAGAGAELRAFNHSLNGGPTNVYPFRHMVSDSFGSGGGTPTSWTVHPLRGSK